MPCEWWGFPLWQLGIGTVPSTVCILRTVLSFFWAILSLVLGQSAEYSREPFCSSSLTSRHLGFLRLPFVSPQLRYAAVPWCFLSAWKQVSLGNCRAYCICFTFLRHHCSSLPDVQFLESLWFLVFCLAFSCFRWEVNSSLLLFLGHKHKSLKKI